MSKHVANLKSAVQLLEGRMELRDSLAEAQTTALKQPLAELHETLQKVADTDWGIRRGDKTMFSGAIALEIERVDRVMTAIDQWYAVQTDPAFVFEREILERAFLSEVVHKVVNELSKDRSETNVDVKIPEDLQVTTSVDRLAVAISALLENAIKFSNGDVVAIEAGINEDDELWIDIVDKGPGLQGKDPNDLWKALSQREGPDTKENKDGLSIGLYMARIMIQSLNGVMELTDVEAGGLCASIFLPQRRTGDI
jgi:K+-sensing histidine kinase KdpD